MKARCQLIWIGLLHIFPRSMLVCHIPSDIVSNKLILNCSITEHSHFTESEDTNLSSRKLRFASKCAYSQWEILHKFVKDNV